MGSRCLFKSLNIKIHEREHIGLIGPNGSGKTTLMKILAGMVDCDDGEVIYRKGIKMVYLPQVEQFQTGQTIMEAALEAAADDPEEEHEKQANAAIILGQMGFEDMDAKIDDLSGGWLKRLSIGRQLAREPDVMLLDEPTNHLDMDGVEWLEDYLNRANFSYMVVTHDRRFLNNAANRIIEINPIFDDGMLSYNCPYNEFMDRRQAFLDGERSRYESLANKNRREQEWVKAGVKARTTKQRARVQEAEELQNEVHKLKQQTKTPDAVTIEFETTERKTKRLIAAHNLCKAFDDINIVQHLDLVLSPGSRVGLLGKNGIGKTTLVKLLAGELDPDAGNVAITTGCKIMHFDQKRQLVDETETLKEALNPGGGDTVIYRDKPLHISSWARKLKFKGEQLQLPVGKLSGGERARLILGRLMLQPADVLLLDEPTNDLDIPAIEVLEESLMEFPGAVVMVTHDRELLDRVSTALLALDGTGKTGFFSSYNQWKKTQKPVYEKEQKKTAVAKDETAAQKPKAAKPQKLSYNEQREWDNMEENIMLCEGKLEMLQNNPVSYEEGQEKFNQYCAELESTQAQIENLYARWQELEAKIKGLTEA